MRPMKRDLVATVKPPGGTARDTSFVLQGPDGHGRYAITVDGVMRTVDAKQVRPGTWSVLIGHDAFLVDVSARAQGVAVGVGQTDALIAIEEAARRKMATATSRAGAAKSGESVKAPIAGKVVKVLVAPGEVVAAGHAVIVLEAMKMENEIVAERGGTVKVVRKTAGQAVEIGELLIELA